MDYVKLVISAINPNNFIRGNRFNRILDREITSLDRKIAEKENITGAYEEAIRIGKYDVIPLRNQG